MHVSKNLKKKSLWICGEIGHETHHICFFFLLKALKESFIKAIGTGLNFDLQRVEFHLTSEPLTSGQVLHQTKMHLDDEEEDWIFEVSFLWKEKCKLCFYCQNEMRWTMNDRSVGALHAQRRAKSNMSVLEAVCDFVFDWSDARCKWLCSKVFLLFCVVQQHHRLFEIQRSLVVSIVVFSLTRGFLSVGVNWVVKAVNDLALQKEGQWFNPPFFIMQFSFSPYCESMVLWFYSHSPKRSLEIG